MLQRIVLGLLIAVAAPGCASAIASALGASGTSARAAADLDAAMVNAAVEGLTSGDESHPRHAPPADEAAFGGEPSFVCRIPGDEEPQIIAASSHAGAVASCAAMNAMPPDTTCACEDLEDGHALAEPVALQP